MKNEFDKVIAFLDRQLIGITSFKSINSGSLISSVRVDSVPLENLASIGGRVPTIEVRPFNQDDVNKIKNSLVQSGFNAYIKEKNCIAVSIPPPSGEDKPALRKRVLEIAESSKVSIRMLRQGLIKSGRNKDDVQKEVDDAVSRIEERIKKKLDLLK